MSAIKDILQRIRNDRAKQQGTWIGIDESHIILNALEKSERIEAENAELRERLKKAVEFPFENLDKVFILAGEDTKTKQFIPDRIVEGTIVGFGYDVYEWVDGNYKFNYYILVGENNYIFALEQFNKTLFKTREDAEAEARIKELQGGER